MSKANEILGSLIEQADTVIHGKKDKIQLIMATWLAGGHVLLEDLPGTGKTILSKTLAKILGLDFKRVQFTPDMLPTDITGGLIIDSETKKLILRKGPIFSTFLLGDEINRATPRTQSALLEAMAEKQITIDGETHQLSSLFFVIATQNPVEQHGTFPLPEAQLDRFMIKLSLGHPNKSDEIRMIKERERSDPLDNISNSINKNLLQQLREFQTKIDVHESIYEYILDLVEATRSHPSIAMGASPRASLYLLNLAKGLSLVRGQSYVKPTTIYEIFPYVINHRLALKPEAKFEGEKIRDISKTILKKIKAPVLK